MVAAKTPGTIRADELYPKPELLRLLGASQKTWDEMLNNGLRFSRIGKWRWVNGQDVIDYAREIAETKEVAAARR